MSDTVAAMVVPRIQFDSFKLCAFSREGTMEVAWTVISLGYGKLFPNLPCFQTTIPVLTFKDLLAFSVILYLASRSANRMYGIPSLLRTIVRDATIYFLVIFTSHLVLVITLLFARVGFQMFFTDCNYTERFI